MVVLWAFSSQRIVRSLEFSQIADRSDCCVFLWVKLEQVQGFGTKNFGIRWNWCLCHDCKCSWRLLFDLRHQFSQTDRKVNKGKKIFIRVEPDRNRINQFCFLANYSFRIYPPLLSFFVYASPFVFFPLSNILRLARIQINLNYLEYNFQKTFQYWLLTFSPSVSPESKE